jgi:predicted metal-dependent phosphoesterase TrpH
MPWYRADLHNHCDCDRQDALGYSAGELIEAYHRAGVRIVAITPHRDIFHDEHAADMAARLGMLLIPGVETLVSGREVVVLNLRPGDLPHHATWADLRELRQKRGPSILVFAPHPFYPRASCVGPDLEIQTDCFDAVEWCHLYGFGFNPNRPAAAWAKRHHKPLLANSDAHHLDQVARNTLEIETGTLDIPSVFHAIRAGRVRNLTRPYTVGDVFHFALRVELPNTLRKLARHTGIHRRP